MSFHQFKEVTRLDRSLSRAGYSNFWDISPRDIPKKEAPEIETDRTHLFKQLCIYDFPENGSKNVPHASEKLLSRLKPSKHFVLGKRVCE